MYLLCFCECVDGCEGERKREKNILLVFVCCVEREKKGGGLKDFI